MPTAARVLVPRSLVIPPRLEELSQAHSHCLRQYRHGLHRHARLASLDPPHERPMEAGLIGEGLLRADPSLLTKGSNPLSDPPPKQPTVHEG